MVHNNDIEQAIHGYVGQEKAVGDGVRGVRREGEVRREGQRRSGNGMRHAWRSLKHER